MEADVVNQRRLDIVVVRTELDSCQQRIIDSNITPTTYFNMELVWVFPNMYKSYLQSLEFGKVQVLAEIRFAKIAHTDSNLFKKVFWPKRCIVLFPLQVIFFQIGKLVWFGPGYLWLERLVQQC